MTSRECCHPMLNVSPVGKCPTHGKSASVGQMIRTDASCERHGDTRYSGSGAMRNVDCWRQGATGNESSRGAFPGLFHHALCRGSHSSCQDVVVSIYGWISLWGTCRNFVRAGHAPRLRSVKRRFSVVGGARQEHPYVSQARMCRRLDKRFRWRMPRLASMFMQDRHG